MRCLEERAARSSRCSGASASRSASGSPDAAASVARTSPASNRASPRSSASAAAASHESEQAAGRRDSREELLGEVEGSGERLVVGRRVEAVVAPARGGPRRSSRPRRASARWTTSKALVTRGRASRSTSRAVGVTSATIVIAPDSTFGSSASRSPCGLRWCCPAKRASWSSGSTQIMFRPRIAVCQLLHPAVQLPDVDLAPASTCDAVASNTTVSSSRSSAARDRAPSCRSRAPRPGAPIGAGRSSVTPPRGRRAPSVDRRAGPAARRTDACQTRPTPPRSSSARHSSKARRTSSPMSWP